MTREDGTRRRSAGGEGSDGERQDALQRSSANAPKVEIESEVPNFNFVGPRRSSSHWRPAALSSAPLFLRSSGYCSYPPTSP